MVVQLLRGAHQTVLVRDGDFLPGPVVTGQGTVVLKQKLAG